MLQRITPMYTRKQFDLQLQVDLDDSNDSLLDDVNKGDVFFDWKSRRLQRPTPPLGTRGIPSPYETN